MAEISSKTYQKNIEFLRKAESCLDNVQPPFKHQGGLPVALSSIRTVKAILVEHRKEIELEKHRKDSDIPLQYSWWFYPKYSPGEAFLPIELISNSHWFSHWIDAVNHAVENALSRQMLTFTREGSFVLVLNGRNEHYGLYQLYVGRTSLLKDGTLPELYCPREIAVSNDLISLMRSMQSYLDADTDEIDGPQGYRFILAQPIKY
jgi:hypothetical protein